MASLRMCSVAVGLLLLVTQCLAQQQTPKPQQQKQSNPGSRLNDPSTVFYLMDRPTEPLLAPKGENNEVMIIVPEEHWPERYKYLPSNLQDRIAQSTDSSIVVPNMRVPNISLAYQLPRDAKFSHFIPLHRQMAREVVEAYMAMPNISQFLTAAALTRDSLNPDLWVYCMQVVLTHRNDTQTIDVPSLLDVMPDKFVDGAAFRQARQDVTMLPAEDRNPIIIPQDWTANNMDMEHWLAYFREDMAVNLHHWTWHLVYPFSGTREMVDKDRRGELFAFQHGQFIARYDFERLCNKMLRVVPLSNFNEPIKEAYFPKLDTMGASRNWPSRQENSRMRDINRPGEQLVYQINQLEIWRERILQAIQEGRALASNLSYVDLANFRGIDVLGNMMEASILNINSNLYGDLHNLVHVAISLVHDPDGRYLETFGVMGDLATAMRDPAFYRWHKEVDRMFQQHKATLTPYSVAQLIFTGITITSVTVQTPNYPANQFFTGLQESDVSLSRGLDISPRGPVYARFTHLQHLPFVYRIQVQNSGQRRNGTVRIFMAPKFDERGLPMPLSVQRELFILMDSFTVTLMPGTNTIERQSTQSGVTIPFERSFRTLDNTRQTPVDQQFNYCGCGWPQHMLVPKGSPEGFPAELYVMVSDYAGDRVDQPPPTGCRAGYCFCGLFNRKYPDARSMGYPLDRPPRAGIQTIRQFLTPNMRLQDVSINFTNRVLYRRVGANGTQVVVSTP